MSSTACQRSVLLIVATLLAYSGGSCASRLLQTSSAQLQSLDTLHAGATLPKSRLRREALLEGLAR